MKRITLFTLTIFISLMTSGLQLLGQNITQTIRGSVTDKISNITLPGANIIIVGSQPLLGTSTDADGNFKITGVPVGKHTLKITFLGYKEIVLPNVVVNSGKEVVLNIPMEEDFIVANEVVITAEKNNHIVNNEMATVSTRTFSVEETQKYAAAVNDPGRMATSYAGVISADDGNNNISIRGNSPNGLLWRMEGVEIPNPNHFSAPGSAGGGISILSAQVMANSDFMTAAFPAEYGNALSGVFDIRLRKGNNEKKEFTLQAGLLGIDVAAEGPFSSKYKGSYLINYRYSTLSMLGKLGVNIGDGSTDFQDLSYNVFLPAGKIGTFTLFGFGGLSSQKFDAKKDSLKWEESYERYSFDFHANTGAAGLTHSIILGNNTYIKSALVASQVKQTYTENRLDNEYINVKRHDELNDESKLILSSTLNHKFSARHSIRTGFIVNKIGFNINQQAYNQDIDAIEEYVDQKGSTYAMQLFAQSSYYITPELVMNSGLHFQQFYLNNTYSIEPRLSFKYELNKKSSVSVGYGLHSQLQTMGIYFATNESGNAVNHDLGMTKSHHFVLGYDRMITASMRVKSELYYQSLFNVPVRSDISNSFSMLNVSQGYIADPLTNKGTGSNYGLELTVEQFLKKNYYFLLSGSLYESKYKGSDHVERDTRFNVNYGFSLTAGKEISTDEKFKNRIIGLNIKTILAGGFRDTPIDLEATQALPGQGVVYEEDKAFTIKYPAYFRTDIRVSVKRNRPNSTQTLALDIQNVTNRKNIYGKYYNEESQSIKTAYQTSLIPILSYKIEF